MRRDVRELGLGRFCINCDYDYVATVSCQHTLIGPRLMIYLLYVQYSYPRHGTGQAYIPLLPLHTNQHTASNRAVCAVKPFLFFFL